MGVLNRLIKKAQGQKPESEPVPVPEAKLPIEEKLEQSDEERLVAQEERLRKLSAEERKNFVPEEDIKLQRKLDEENNPSK